MNEATNGKIFSTKSKKYYTLGFAAILAIAFVHFAAQMFLIQNENSCSVETAVEIAPPVLTAEPETISRKQVTEEKAAIQETEIVSPAEIAAPKMPRQPKVSRPPQFVPVRTAERKKIVLESRAARLRRAEQILTGI